MNNKTTLVITSVIASLSLFTACSPSVTINDPSPATPEQSRTQAQAQAPTPRAEELPDTDEGISEFALDAVLDALPQDDLRLMCDYIDEYPYDAFQMFDEGAEGSFTYEQFLDAFARAC